MRFFLLTKLILLLTIGLTAQTGIRRPYSAANTRANYEEILPIGYEAYPWQIVIENVEPGELVSLDFFPTRDNPGFIWNIQVDLCIGPEYTVETIKEAGPNHTAVRVFEGIWVEDPYESTLPWYEQVVVPEPVPYRIDFQNTYPVRHCSNVFIRITSPTVNFNEPIYIEYHFEWFTGSPNSYLLRTEPYSVLPNIPSGAQEAFRLELVGNSPNIKIIAEPAGMFSNEVHYILYGRLSSNPVFTVPIIRNGILEDQNIFIDPYAVLLVPNNRRFEHSIIYNTSLHMIALASQRFIFNRDLKLLEIGPVTYLTVPYFYQTTITNNWVDTSDNRQFGPTYPKGMAGPVIRLNYR